MDFPKGATDTNGHEVIYDAIADCLKCVCWCKACRKEKEKLTGIELIAKERRRQIFEEEHSQFDDMEHDCGELADAARCYALDPILKDPLCPPNDWPWVWDKWKPKGQIRDLVRAGALIAAEIDRIRHEC